MILTLKKFFVNKDNDYSNMAERVGARRIFLDNFLAGKVPNDGYGVDKLLVYCQSLIDGQRKALPGLKGGSWSISPDPSGVSEEDLMDYHYFPTFIAIAMLTACAEKFPEEIGSLPGLEEAIVQGYDFAIGCNLEGYGFNSLFQQLESVLILGSGGCINWLANHPEACPLMVERLREIALDYKTHLDKGDTVLSFGGDYKLQYSLAVGYLEPLMG